MSAYLELSNFPKLAEIAQGTLQIVPDDRKSSAYLEAIKKGRTKDEIVADVEMATSPPEYFLNKSLGYYQARDYEKCIEAAKQALKLKPDYGPAYNNICAAFNELKQWDKAIEAGERAVQLNPGSQLALNNLARAKEHGTGAPKLASFFTAAKTPEQYLNISLGLYQEKKYSECIEAAKEALKLKPDFDMAYNNICAAYNELKQWDKAIEAGERAVKINPGNSLAANNLAFAKSRKSIAGKSAKLAAR